MYASIFRTLTLFLIVMTCGLMAQIPQTISYQGILADTAGNPRPDSIYSLTFTIYDSPGGGTALWGESKSVATSRGLFQTYLGDQIPFGNLLDFDQPYWLGIRLNADPDFSPRIPFSTVPYSLRAQVADTAAFATNAVTDTAGLDLRYVQEGESGVISTQMLAPSAVNGGAIAGGTVVRSLNALTENLTIAAGENIIVTTSSDSIIIASTGGGSAITAVNAGTGLTGGGTNGDISLNVGIGTGLTADTSSISLDSVYTDGRYIRQGQSDAITNQMLVDGAVDASKIAPQSVVGSLNGLQDGVIIAGQDGATVTTSGDSIIISAAAGGSGIAVLTSPSATLNITNPVGPTAELDVADGAIGNTQLADSAVTGEKLANATAVRSVNNLQDNVRIVGSNGITVTTGGDSIAISGDPVSTGIEELASDDGSINVLSPTGPFTDISVADSSITSGRLADGAAIRSINNLTDRIFIGASGGATVTTSGDSIIIGAGAVGGSGIQGVQNTDNTLIITDPNGPTATINMADGGVGTQQLADSAVNGDKLATAAVKNEHLADQSITEDKFSSDILLQPNGPAGGDLTGSYPNPQIATDAIGSAEIADGSIGTDDVADSSITAAKLAADVTVAPGGAAGGDLTGSYPNPQIADAVIGQSNLTEDAVGSAEIINGSVDTDDLADSSITAAKLASGLTFTPGGAAGGDLTGTYPNPEITDNAVDGAALADAAVSGNHVADNQLVRSLNSLRDNVTIAATGGATITTSGDTILINAGSGGGGTGIQGVQNTNSTLDIINPNGPTATINISNGGVTETQLADNAVTQAKLAAASVGAGELIEGSVGSTALAADAVTAAAIAADAVGADAVIDGSIGTAELGADAVTAAQIATGAVGIDELAANSVTAAAIATDAVGTDELAANSVGSSEISDLSIGANDIADGAITQLKLAAGVGLPPSGAAGGHLIGTYPNPNIADGVIDQAKLTADAVGSAEIIDGSITASELAVNAVNNLAMADDAVGAAEIIDGSVTAEEIAADAVTSAAIATDAVGADELAANSVGSSEINDLSIAAADIADGAITQVKLAAGVGLPPTGAAGGALSGTYPNPTIADAVISQVNMTEDAIGSGEIIDGSVTAAELANNAVGNAAMADNAVGAAEIIDGSIGSSKLAAEAVTAAAIATGAVGTDEIATDAVTASEIAANAVGSAEINDLSVSAEDIADGAITQAKLAIGVSLPITGIAGGELTGLYPNPSIADGVIDQANLTTDAVGSAQIIDGSITSVDLAANSVDAAAIAINAVGAAEIAAGAVGTSEISDLSIAAADIADGAITQAKLAAGVGLPPSGAAGGDLTGTYPNPTIGDGVVDQGNLAADAVGSTEIVDASITSADLAANSVNATAIANGAVGAAQIAANAVGASEIAANAVGTSEISDLSIASIDIADGAITQAKLAAGVGLPPSGAAGGDLTGTYPNPTIGDGVVDQGNLAADAVGSVEIIDGSITSADLAANSVTAAAIATNAVAAAEIAANAVGASEIATNAVGAAEIAAGAVGTSEISDLSIASVDIADGAITQAKLAAGVGLPPSGAAGGDLTGTYPNPTIADSVIGQTKMQANSIGTGEIIDLSITASDLATNSVTAAKIAANAVGASEIATNAVGALEIAASAVANSEIAANAVTVDKISPNIISSIENVVNDGGNIDLVAGSNMTITANDVLNTITFSSTGGGSSQWSDISNGISYLESVAIGDLGILRGDTRLEVHSKQLYGARFTADLATPRAVPLYAEYTGIGTFNAVAAFGRSVPNANYGIGGEFQGGRIGVRGLANTQQADSAAYGVWGTATRSFRDNFGVYGEAMNGLQNYGVYGFAQNGEVNYAVFAEGDLVYTGGLFKVNPPKTQRSFSPLNGALQSVLRLQPQRSVGSADAGQQFDLDTQNLKANFPELVKEYVSQAGRNAGQQVTQVNYMDMIPVLVGAIQEQQAQIEQQQKTLEALKAEIEILKSEQ